MAEDELEWEDLEHDDASGVNKTGKRGCLSDGLVNIATDDENDPVNVVFRECVRDTVESWKNEPGRVSSPERAGKKQVRKYNPRHHRVGSKDGRWGNTVTSIKDDTTSRLSRTDM